MSIILQPLEIKKEIHLLVLRKEEDINWELADMLSCTPITEWKSVHVETYRDNDNHAEAQVWYYESKPIMKCRTWWDETDNQLKYLLERIDKNEKIITI